MPGGKLHSICPLSIKHRDIAAKLWYVFSSKQDRGTDKLDSTTVVNSTEEQKYVRLWFDMKNCEPILKVHKRKYFKINMHQCTLRFPYDFSM